MRKCQALFCESNEQTYPIIFEADVNIILLKFLCPYHCMTALELYDGREPKRYDQKRERNKS